jgi:hypothetical protein
MASCSGDGECLGQTDLEYSYEKRIDITCTHNCQPIKCPNYLVCGALEPQRILWCYHGTCHNCHWMCGEKFGGKGALKFTKETECPICMDTKTCVEGLRCEHNICVDCFKRCHYGDHKPQPQFPYSREIEDKYDETSRDARWLGDPLIAKWKADWVQYERDEEFTYRKEASLRVCPLCRK